MNQLMSFILNIIFFVLSNLFIVIYGQSFNPPTGCPAEFKGKCHCGTVPYGNSGRELYVTNCTNANFTDASMLVQLPIETEILIFTGNNITNLPANLLGQDASYEKLHTIDMSNNNIRSIKGKTFHNVKSVRILTLDNNEIEIDDENYHPRIFSNFENLEELNLRNAFGNQEKSKEFMKVLTRIFTESALTNLKSLNLESNEIHVFSTPIMFCFLPKLQKLYLGHNLLTNFHLNLTCLKDLNLVDLTDNLITTLHNESLRYLESGPRYYHLNITRNPFRCDCKMRDLLTFIKTVIEVRITTPESLYCSTAWSMDIVGKYFDEINIYDLPCTHITNDDLSTNYYINFSYAIITCLLSILIILVATFIFFNRKFIVTSWRYVINGVQVKREYTSLEKEQSNKRYQQVNTQEIAENVV